jgi:hypothetical protein
MKFLTTLVTLFVCLSCFAQKSSVENLVFSSPFEKLVIERFIESPENPNYFDLLMAPGKVLRDQDIVAAQEKLKLFTQGFQTAKFNKLTEEKKIQTLHQAIHKQFLLQYVTQVSFENIFISGQFNNLTSSALYALIFNALQIPYVLELRNNAVFIRAYPNSKNILIQTENTQGGNVLSAAFKQQYLNSLRQQKIISEREFLQSDREALFHKYFQIPDNTTVTILDLIGYQYFNESVYYSGDENYQQAIPSVQKALLFIKDESYTNTLLGYRLNAFLNAKHLSLQQAKLLGDLTKHFNEELKMENLIVDFSEILIKALKEENFKSLATFMDWLVEYSYDSAFSTTAQFLYNYEIGRLAYNNRDYEKAEEFVGKAVNVYTKQEAIDLLAASIVSNLQSKMSNSIVFYENIMEALDGSIQQYPTLIQSNAFLSVMANLMLEQCNYLFTYQKSKEGEILKQKFEQHMKTYSETDINHELLGKAYSAMAVYYYRRGEVARAKSNLKKGLEFAPNNFDLIRRLEMIK